MKQSGKSQLKETIHLMMILDEFEEKQTKFINFVAMKAKARGGGPDRNQNPDRGYGRNNNFPERGRENGRNNSYGNYNPCNNSRKNYNPLHMDEECHLHGGHPWCNCIYIP